MTKQKYCSRCGTFTDDFYPTQQYICKKCVKEDRKRRYVRRGRKHLRTERSCKDCGATEGLIKNGFYKDGEQRYSNMCNKCRKPNNRWQEANRDKLNYNKRIERAKLQDTKKANAKTLIRKWFAETGEKERVKFDYWMETKEVKPYLVFDRFFSNNFLREDLL